LKCHYCGHREKLPGFCQACGSANLKTIGFGTEKIEDDLKLLLSEAKVQRMDWDTTRNKYGYERILEEFENGNIDILVGTQMVSKGLDFGRVNLVAILDVDRMLNFPDFRSYERTFQLVTQVSGRAGRREKSGRVIIQTAHPDHPLLEWIINNDYEGFFGAELAERKVFNYPPFVRVIRITIRHKDQQKVMEAATELGETLKLQLGKRRVLGPEEPLIGRIRNQYLRQILLKIERERVNLHAVKEIVHNSVSKLAGKKEYRKVDFVFDVDPY
jgi:primosomal protein N' (replication factor Y)